MLQTCAENNVDNIGMFSLLVSRAYTELSTFLLLTTPPLSGLGWTKSHTNWPKGYSIWYDVAFNKKSSGRGRGGKGIFGLLAFVFPSNDHKWWGFALLEMSTCLPVGSSELNPYFALLSCATFALLNCLYLKPQFFMLLFTFLFSHLPLWRGSKWAIYLSIGDKKKKMDIQLSITFQLDKYLHQMWMQGSHSAETPLRPETIIPM